MLVIIANAGTVVCVRVQYVCIVSVCVYIFGVYIYVLGIKFSAFHMVGKHCTSELKF